ncbi:MAG TPA: sulfatase [Gammaproteobacteria bacterium]|jgi:N-sulfoglucosamine sulfohydrolase|nr:MAG: sulfatase [Gammaproteobacteria bacterium TMED134]RZO72775.1 MAG: sulfatase [OM182 bacterium]HAL42745.1 sulfatase [Gammaproteobacteria bacterium]|tara:strand:+ start:8821 stop:10578 length:1758 start_codon:yes stop_codon:yes gene_type:complete
MKTRPSLLSLTLLLLSIHAHPTLQTQPNILLLVAEDLSPRVGAFGDQVAKTPNIDDLANRGLRLKRVFTAAGVCAPSRAALLMGEHSIRFGAHHMRTSTGPLGPYLAQPATAARAFPELLREAGYFTFTDTKLDYQFSGIGAGTGPITIWDLEGINPLADADQPWSKSRPGQPFFGLINFLQTHESGVMRPSGQAYGAGHEATQAFRQRAGLVAAPVTDPAQVALPPYYPDLPGVRSDLARHYDNIHAMDSQVGRILTLLEQGGLSESTIIIWTTDHGDGLPRAKRELFDSGIHVPMVVYIPPALRPQFDIPQAGAASESLISFVDLAPTILNLAGITPPNTLKGRNFLSNDQPNRRFIFASRDRIDEVVDRQRAARNHRYKLIRSFYPQVPGGHRLAYRDNLDMVRAWRQAYEEGALNTVQESWFQPVPPERLFDLEQDPWEIHDLLQHGQLTLEQEQNLQQLRIALDTFIAAGDLGALPEAELRSRYLVQGELPLTPAPLIAWRQGQATLSSEVSASIAFRVSPSEAWRLYTGPVAATWIEAKAIRYGWRESPSRISAPGAPDGSATTPSEMRALSTGGTQEN